ncbi:hypothetical protein LJR098_004141 [Rhizobium sp. LjRoot98]|uniref:hypothetical protein n=1 Tax=Rhizobium sp. LjRoot98 TaxID=3342345 RepID=UPI003ED0AEBE
MTGNSCSFGNDATFADHSTTSNEAIVTKPNIVAHHNSPPSSIDAIMGVDFPYCMHVISRNVDAIGPEIVISDHYATIMPRTDCRRTCTLKAITDEDLSSITAADVRTRHAYAAAYADHGMFRPKR